jgi:hypothetical protein
VISVRRIARVASQLSAIDWRIVQVRRPASSLSRPLRDIHIEQVLKRKLLPSQRLYEIPVNQCSAQSDSL